MAGRADYTHIQYNIYIYKKQEMLTENKKGKRSLSTFSSKYDTLPTAPVISH